MTALSCGQSLTEMTSLGSTRLTGSGLSMVEWKPVTGVLPPLSQDDWEEVFDLYQQSPEFQLVNLNMDLEGFKGNVKAVRTDVLADKAAEKLYPEWRDRFEEWKLVGGDEIGGDLLWH